MIVKIVVAGGHTIRYHHTSRLHSLLLELGRQGEVKEVCKLYRFTQKISELAFKCHKMIFSN